MECRCFSEEVLNKYKKKKKGTLAINHSKAVQSPISQCLFVKPRNENSQKLLWKIFLSPVLHCKETSTLIRASQIPQVELRFS